MEIEEKCAEALVGRMLEAYLPHLIARINCRVQDRQERKAALSDVAHAIMSSAMRYDPQRPFEPWARGIAQRVITENLRKARRHRWVLEEEVSETLVWEGEALGDVYEERKEHLNGCVHGLPPRHQRLIRQRFFEELSYEKLSGLTGKTVPNLYVIMKRVQIALSVCIRRQMNSL